MNRIQELKQYLIEGKHHHFRREIPWNLAEKFASCGLPACDRRAEALAAVLEAEIPVFLPQERIAFLRTVKNLPELFTAKERETMNKEHTWSEQGMPFNFTPDYGSVISIGLEALTEKINARIKQAEAENDAQGVSFLQAGLRSIRAVQNLADRYQKAAEEAGLAEIAETLRQVPRLPARNFLEALQFFRILHYTLWCEGEYHNGAGRIDLLFMPYLQHDLDSGALTEQEAFELFEEFFLSFNRDSDLYIGVQQGDNGQSLMIGGCDKEGNEVWNLLSEMTLRASCELKVIDPKINFRVSKDTPVERLALGSALTRAGLGFPQYSNDDVVIPALVKWGYSLEDARTYSVAACWEFLIPGVCHEFVNLDGLSLPQMVLECMESSKALCYKDFLDDLNETFRRHAKEVVAHYANIAVLPSAFISMLCPVAIEKARNITEAGKYHNWGIHGTGFSVAADSLYALKKVVFDSKEKTLPELCGILKKDFEGEYSLLAEVRTLPKLGQNSAEADSVLCDLVRLWGKCWEGLTNSQGGRIRPGTGSAMYYIWHSENLQATPDGRKKGEPFSANYAPSLDHLVDGPLSVVRSFTAPEMSGVCNGGPLTIELHDSVFSDPQAERKLAEVIAEFIRRGGHQLQLNSINRDTLKEAQLHPERYRNLIVRVWGWSGYFVELDKKYQDHIIRRAEMSLA